LYSIMGDFTGCSFLDVFGGSGIMGLEAISRGFSYVKVIEQNKKAADIIKKNYNSLGLIPNLIIGDSVKILKNSNYVYDVVYIDPPYKSGLYEDILPLANGKIIILESSQSINLENYDIIKSKTYGGNIITFIKNPLNA